MAAIARCVIDYAVPFVLAAEAGMLMHLFVFDSIAPEFRSAPGFVEQMLLVPLRWTLTSTVTFVTSLAVTRWSLSGVGALPAVAGVVCGLFVGLVPMPVFWDCPVAVLAGYLVGARTRERGRPRGSRLSGKDVGQPCA